MTPRARLMTFGVGVVGLIALLTVTLVRLPGPADLRNRYSAALTARTFAERNITDVVTAVNFDYRGFDTVGEEFILFVSVMGSLVLLRQADEKKVTCLPDAASPGRDVPPSDAMLLWTLLMVGPKLAFGIYIVTHGQLSPGGGFQGGVILASVALIIYLGLGFETFKGIMTHPLVDAAEAIGAAGFVLIGLVAVFFHAPFLTNVLPLGKSNELTSGGTIPLISGAVGLEVAAGFVLLLYAFLQENLTSPSDKGES
jgi:multicomponent Na+:H+ antiporter subunit B